MEELEPSPSGTGARQWKQKLRIARRSAGTPKSAATAGAIELTTPSTSAVSAGAAQAQDAEMKSGEPDGDMDTGASALFAALQRLSLTAPTLSDARAITPHRLLLRMRALCYLAEELEAKGSLLRLLSVALLTCNTARVYAAAKSGLDVAPALLGE
jgi:hypothetical protein